MSVRPLLIKSARIRQRPIYMKFQGIDGDVTAEGHKKWIDLGSLQWGVGRGSVRRPAQAAERESSAPSISEVTVTKMMDKTTPLLFTEALIGDGKKVEIHLVKTSKDKLETFMEERCHRHHDQRLLGELGR